MPYDASMKIRVLIPLAVLLACSSVVPPSARADEAPEKAAVCTGCHGETGIPADKATPVINGQQEGYLYLELRDYKLGHRRNELMQSIAADLSKTEMQELAAWFAAQPWPGLGQPAVPEADARRADLLNGSAGCKGCHGEAYLGDSAIPRSAGQGVEYLRATMQAFRSGERGNNPWMTALLKTYPDADIDLLARYLAGL